MRSRQPLVRNPCTKPASSGAISEGTHMARRKVSPLQPGEKVDYKDVRRLQRFLTERGKVLPRRATGL
ncbi:MAG: 30S ribosomal protein S18, partial [Myxococcales bacterium]|nr:30S ribosomal protein S18 [Myxococcales bacterium]